MKKIVIGTILLVCLGMAAQTVVFDKNWADKPLFNIVSQSQTGCEIVFSTQKLIIEDIDIDGVPMKTFGVPAVFLQDPGVPNLTGANRFLAVPQGARAHLTILDTRTEVYHNVEVAPAPNIPNELDDQPLRYEKNMAIYDHDAFYPASPVVVSKQSKIRGVDVVKIGVVPFQYNPISKELIVYKDIKFRVDFTGGNGHFGEDRLRSRFWEPILQGHLINYNSLPKIDFYAPQRTEARDGYEYIIIVPDDPIFEAWGDTIKNWRKLQGISCEVYTLTEIGGATSSAIESFLNTAYNTWDPAPVAFLLLSDYPSSGETYGITSPLWDSYCVSDNIYADVDGDDLPDMHHARITAQGETHLNTMINKFLSYERNPYTSPNFYDNPLVACGWQDDRWFQLATEVVRGYLINELGKDPARQYNPGSPANIYPGCAWSTRTGSEPVVQYWHDYGYIPLTNPYDATWWNNGSAAGVNAAINSGAFFVQHRDHGGTSGWSEPSYHSEHLDNLTNTEFTFVNSTNCLTGMYDYYSEVFAEKFHRIDYGCWGINAASEVSYSFVNDTYIWGMWDGFFADFDPGYPSTEMPGHDNLRPCMAMTYGKYYLEAMWFPDSVPYVSEYRVYTYHLFHHHSDAFTTLYSEVPMNLTVNHDDEIFAGVPTFAVTANDSSVIALTVDGEIIGVAEGTGAPVHITLSPSPLPGQTMKVTVTKANYYRYDVDVPVISTGPYVVASTSIIDDTSGGNADGMANPGETIDYGIWAKNIGTEDAYSVYGYCYTADPAVSVSVDSSWFGTVGADDSVLSDPYYELTIGNSCPNGYAVTCTLEFHDVDDSIYMSYPSFLIYAPVITYQSVIVENDDNLNNMLEPGETADLIVTLANEGGATAENITATLTTISPHLTITDDYGSFGTIDPGNNGDNTADPFTVEADNAAPYGSEVDMSLIVQAGVYMDTLDFTVDIGQSVPSDTGYYYAYFSSGLHPRSPEFNWIAIDSTQSTHVGTSLNLSDDVTIAVTLPFTFTYYGINYTNMSLSSNGWIAMGNTTSTDNTNTHIPDLDGPPRMIAGMWCDLDPGNYGAPSDVYYYYDTTNHRFIVEYFRCEHYPAGNQETFEIILYDPAYYATPTGDGEIVIQYLTSLQVPDMTLGVENSTESVGVEYYFNNTYNPLADAVTDSFAILYTTYPPDYTGVEEQEELTPLPLQTKLNRFAPNPFTRSTAISFQISQPSTVEMKAYDATGRLVRTLSQGVHEPGYYNVDWNGSDDIGRKIPAGIYFVRFTASALGAQDTYTKVNKVVFLR